MSVKDCVIIGGGIGGLFTGAFLAKNGVRVTVLEKNGIIGGGLQCFRRGGKLFETGMHIMGGFGKDGILSRICHYLDILDSLKIHHIDSECVDEIRYGRTGDVYRIPSGREAFVARMSEYFPDEAAGIRAYVEEIFRLAAEAPLYKLMEVPEGRLEHSERFTWPADRLIAHYVIDSRLRELLAYLNPLYGGVRGETPAFVHAFVNVLYIQGASRFVDGSQQLADALRGVIEANGGEVLAGHEVTRIEMADGKVAYAETVSGGRFSADRYVAAVHPVELLRLLPADAFVKAFRRRLNEIPNSYSAFSLYIDLKPGMFRYIPHTCYYMDDYGSMWTQDASDGAEWPRGFMYMTPPESGQGEYAGRLLVHCVMDFAQVREWEDSVTGQRPPAYYEWKQRCTDMLLDRLERVITGLRDMTANVYASSPLTIRDFYHTKDGSMFGYRKDCGNLMLSRLSVQTRIGNLIMAGQNVNLHGICGVPLTSISAAESILGANEIIRQINHATQ